MQARRRIPQYSGKNKTKLFLEIRECSLFTYDVMVNVSLANQAY